jgi:phosphoribosyl 1,2-cyclic phosphodiesterase
MKIKMWGCRGSYPTTGPSTVRYGGNTPCVEVRTKKNELIILDGGTGIRGLGNQLMGQEFGKGRGGAVVLLSHPHWDHIQGFPFFTPMYVKGNKFMVYGQERKSVPLPDIFAGQTRSEYFPVPFSKLNASIEFFPIKPGSHFKVFGIKVKTARGNHPGVSICYRLQEGNTSLVYIPDTAPYRDLIIEESFIADPDEIIIQHRSRNREIDKYHRRLCKLVQGADVLIFDTFFTGEDFLPHYGHATYRDGIDLALATGVKHLLCFHHKPDRSDSDLDQLEERYSNLIRSTKLELTVAREGMEMEVGETSK